MLFRSRGVSVYHRLFYSLALYRLQRLDQARAALEDARAAIDMPREPMYTGAREWLQTFERRYGK